MKGSKATKRNYNGVIVEYGSKEKVPENLMTLIRALFEERIFFVEQGDHVAAIKRLKKLNALLGQSIQYLSTYIRD